MSKQLGKLARFKQKKHSVENKTAVKTEFCFTRKRKKGSTTNQSKIFWIVKFHEKMRNAAAPLTLKPHIFSDVVYLSEVR